MVSQKIDTHPPVHEYTFADIAGPLVLILCVLLIILAITFGLGLF